MAVWTAIVVLALAATGCTVVKERLGLVDKAATATAEAIIVNELLQQTQAVENQMATDEAATQQAVAAATQVAVLTATASAEAEATAMALAIETASAQQTQVAQQTATQQAAGMLGTVQDLVKKGFLPSAQGAYHVISDYTGQQNKSDYITIRSTGQSPQTFVIRADVAYSSAGPAPNWSRSACGFMFWRESAQNYYQAYVALDGNVYASAINKNRYVNLGKGFYGPPKTPAGSYQVMLVANAKNFTMFYNGKAVKTIPVVDGSITTGSLNMTVISSFTGDYGMRCTFANIEMWVGE